MFDLDMSRSLGNWSLLSSSWKESDFNFEVIINKY